MRTIIINRRRYREVTACIAIGLLFSASAARGVTHEYTISVDPQLSRLTVEARFARPVTAISARAGDARRYLESARDCDTDKRLRTRGSRLLTPRAGIRCLSYAVDLEAATRRTDHLSLPLDPDNIVVSPTVWMWQPRLQGDINIRVVFQLPDGISVSVPWQPVDGTDDVYTFGASPQSGSAIAVFGRFDAVVEQVAGVKIRIAFLRSQNDIDTARLTDWIRSTAENIALAYGRFPHSAARVVVIPVGRSLWGDDSAVPFGRVVRDGGETIELLINENRPIAEFYEEWTPTHEFSHLMLPYLNREQRWISEGFATYYQNLLLARAGHYTDVAAWQRLYDGLERGRDSAPQLSPNAAAIHGIRDARMKIYWSGVSIALMADVELRRRSGGAESLDTVLDRLQRCCLPSAHTWSGPELFGRLDLLLDKPLFMDLYRTYADTAGFPDSRPLLKQLGVVTHDGAVRLSAAAELAYIRRALTSPASAKAGGGVH